MTLKSFEEFLKTGIIKKITPNKERAKSLIAEAERKMKSMREQLEKIGIKDTNANDYVEYSYNIIMYLIRAKLYFEGYSSAGQNAHEAEVSYLRILKFKENQIQFFDQIRYFRNGMLYYGTMLDEEYAKKVLNFLNEIYPKLIKLTNHASKN